MYSTVLSVKYDDGLMVPSLHEVVMEVPLAVFVNGRHALTAMVSPSMIEEFVTGFLYTEKVIRKPEDIESLRIEEIKDKNIKEDREKNREERREENVAVTLSASILTKNPFSIMLSGKTVLSGCGGDASYLDSERIPKIQSDLVVDVSVIKSIMKETLVSDLHARTGGIHIVGLFGPDGKICVIEDIGRHNALDKAIGYGLKHEVDFSRTVVASSGRLSSEMVRKCLTANIPVIASRGATTTLAISMAEKASLTIVGFVRGQKMNIYTGSERVRNQK